MKYLPLSVFPPVVAALALAAGQAAAADPTTADCLAASDASLKLGNLHKLRAERSQLLVCSAVSCPGDIRKECLARVDEVNAQIPTIVFLPKDASGADLTAVRVTMDGEVLAERLEGTALSIDPGQHTFTFEVAGKPPTTKTLVIVEGQKDRREVVAMKAIAAPSAPTVAPVAMEGQPPRGDGTRTTDSGLGTQQVLAIVAAGIGVVGLGAGSAFGLMTLSKRNDAQSQCPGQCTTESGVSAWSSAATAGNVSTAAFTVGGVGLAGAALLWWTAPRSSAGAPQVGVGPGTFQVKGSW